MTDDARAQAEQRLASKARKMILDEYDVPDTLANVAGAVCAKLAAEEIATAVREDRQRVRDHIVNKRNVMDVLLTEPPIHWHLVCADAEGEKP
jgi:hypothetical protein